MAPLTALSGQAKDKLQPTPEPILSAFEAVEQLIAESVLLAFPDPDVPCDIHADTQTHSWVP